VFQEPQQQPVPALVTLWIQLRPDAACQLVQLALLPPLVVLVVHQMLLTRGFQLVLLPALVLLLLLLLLLLVLLLLPWVVVLAHKLLLMPQRLAPLASLAARLQHQMRPGRSLASGGLRGQLLQELL
jgi:hypothetical protein